MNLIEHMVVSIANAARRKDDGQSLLGRHVSFGQ